MSAKSPLPLRRRGQLELASDPNARRSDADAQQQARVNAVNPPA